VISFGFWAGDDNIVNPTNHDHREARLAERTACLLRSDDI